MPNAKLEDPRWDVTFKEQRTLTIIKFISQYNTNEY